jgi:protein-disulfide isomerase
MINMLCGRLTKVVEFEDLTSPFCFIPTFAQLPPERPREDLTDSLLL